MKNKQPEVPEMVWTSPETAQRRDTSPDQGQAEAGFEAEVDWIQCCYKRRNLGSIINIINTKNDFQAA